MNGRGSKSKIVIIGGGFGGVAAARALSRCDADVLLIDRRNHHVFQPLLYQVATAALSPANIAAPIRKILSGQKNLQTIMGDVNAIDPQRKEVTVDVFGEKEVRPFDYLVLAAGVTTSYFAHPEWEGLAPGLKSIEDALEIRRRFFLAFERAELERNIEKRNALLTFVIVGGGPTGVELAGAMAEVARKTLAKDFSNIDPTQAKIILIEGGDRILQMMELRSSRRALRDLQTLGVEVRLSTLVSAIDEQGVTLLVDGQSTQLDTTTVFWAAGIRSDAFAKQLGVESDRAGRIVVGSDLAVPNHPDIFVVGDLASAKDVSGKNVPGLAPAAIQGGTFVAKIIRDEIAKKIAPRQPADRPRFRYINKGELATIGRARAVAEIGPLKLSGFIAWLIWSVVHVLFLIDFRSKLFTSLEWIWQYLTFGRGARLITGKWNPELDAVKKR